MKSAIIKLKTEHTIWGKSTRYQRTIITTLILFMVNFFLVPMDSQVLAATTGEDWEYVELEDGTIEITKYNGDVSELVIPTQIDDKIYVASGSVGETYAKEQFKTYIFEGDVACEK